MVDLFFVLSKISEIKTIFEIAQAVFYYLEKKSNDLKNQNLISTITYGSEKLAIEKTFQEWESIVSSISPKIEKDSKQYESEEIYDNIEHLSQLCKKYSYLSSDLDLLKIKDKQLLHTALSITPENNIKIYFGKSVDSSSFHGDGILINKKYNTIYTFKENEIMSELPTFKITMLGDSDVGKTIFMAFMYTSLCANRFKFSIRAHVDNHQKLQAIVTNLYKFNRVPGGTQLDSSYEFELFFENKAIAKIDWVDYKGGALNSGAEEKETKFLIERLKSSDAVISMVSLSEFDFDELDSLWATTETKLTTMNTLLRNAMAEGGNIKTVLFVRTKSDEVLNENQEVDLVRALEELIIHVGEQNFQFVEGQPSAAIPVSSAKISTILSDPITYSVNRRSRPMNVEWVVFIALACLLNHEFKLIDRVRRNVTDKLIKSKRSVFMEAILGKKSEEKTAQAELEEAYVALAAIKDSINGIMKSIPKDSIKIFGDLT